ncbi:MAG: hypothetical protein ACK5LJ_16585 [Paracoccus sp. (in: a-proteobacteria)]
MRAERSFTGEPEVDRLLFSWGRVIGQAQGWARGFALSIQRDRKKPGWMPSPKQMAVMQRLVAELPQALPEDFDLIERD